MSTVKIARPAAPAAKPKVAEPSAAAAGSSSAAEADGKKKKKRSKIEDAFRNVKLQQMQELLQEVITDTLDVDAKAMLIPEDAAKFEERRAELLQNIKSVKVDHHLLHILHVFLRKFGMDVLDKFMNKAPRKRKFKETLAPKIDAVTKQPKERVRFFGGNANQVTHRTEQKPDLKVEMIDAALMAAFSVRDSNDQPVLQKFLDVLEDTRTLFDEMCQNRNNEKKQRVKNAELRKKARQEKAPKPKLDNVESSIRKYRRFLPIRLTKQLLAESLGNGCKLTKDAIVFVTIFLESMTIALFREAATNFILSGANKFSMSHVNHLFADTKDAPHWFIYYGKVFNEVLGSTQNSYISGKLAFPENISKLMLLYTEMRPHVPYPDCSPLAYCFWDEAESRWTKDQEANAAERAQAKEQRKQGPAGKKRTTKAVKSEDAAAAEEKSDEAVQDTEMAEEKKKPVGKKKASGAAAAAAAAAAPAKKAKAAAKAADGDEMTDEAPAAKPVAAKKAKAKSTGEPAAKRQKLQK